MKRYFLNISSFAVALLAIVMVGCNGISDERAHTLKVYNWGDYIDEDLIAEFEEWYEEQTGEPVSIIYQTFDINEVMLAKIENGHADFDVVCPSEYIIERMMRNELLQPILTPEFEAEINAKNINYFSCVSPYIKEQFSLLEAPEGQNPNDYSVGYMWGTTGILYNAKHVTEEEAMSWGLMFDKRLQDKIFVKDAFRDVYSPILVYAKTLEKRASGELGENEMLSQQTIRELMYDSSDESIALVESYLKRMKELVAGWEADFGKEMMTQEKAWIDLMWSGDAVWAIDEASEVDVELGYAVPKEGSVMWFDGWVIPKYARNTKAARYFINYMCMPHNAILNMEEIGYVSVIASPEILDWANDEEVEQTSNLTYFFGEGADSVHANHVFYPDQIVIERCALMHDCGDKTEDMLAMWSRVKGDNLTPKMVIFMLVVAVAIVFTVIIRTITKGNQRKKMQRKKRKNKR